MKKALIILLILLILGGAIFAAYHFLWTAESFASLGAEAMDRGEYKTAAERYETAVDLDPDNIDYLLSLVDAHIAYGNYTKAERSIVNAIRRQPSSKLYCELSKLYVMQDKILDAQLMLDTITDPVVRSEVEALRPSVPVFSPESGSYDEYIEVSIQGENGTVYFTDGTSYPSARSEAYSEPMALSAGKSKFQAILIGDNGLVSPLAEADYMVVGVVEELSFESPELENYLRAMLYISRTESILSSDLWDITELSVPDDVRNYNDLRHFPALTKLTIQNSAVEDYSFLTALPMLEYLDLNGCLVSFETLEHIATLSELRYLNLNGCGLSNISPLQSLVNLQTLHLADNSISDIAAIVQMQKLRTLNLRSNAVVSLDALNGMKTLTEFDIAHNKITTLAPLQYCTNMQKLSVDNNALMSVGALSHMVELLEFSASGNQLEDISALANSTKMTRLVVSSNLLTAVDCIAKMPDLTYLDVSHNQITELPAIEATAHLQQFYASYNQLSAIDTLAGLKELTYVDVDYNEEIENIEVLSSCPLLVQVNAFGTHVVEVKLLTDYGVIVNYDPSYADQRTE